MSSLKNKLACVRSHRKSRSYSETDLTRMCLSEELRTIYEYNCKDTPRLDKLDIQTIRGIHNHERTTLIKEIWYMDNALQFYSQKEGIMITNDIDVKTLLLSHQNLRKDVVDVLIMTRSFKKKYNQIEYRNLLKTKTIPQLLEMIDQEKAYIIKHVYDLSRVLSVNDLNVGCIQNFEEVKNLQNNLKELFAEKIMEMYETVPSTFVLGILQMDENSSRDAYDELMEKTLEDVYLIYQKYKKYVLTTIQVHLNDDASVDTLLKIYKDIY